MKNITKYLIVSLLFTTICKAQSYEFGIVHVSGNTFKIVGIPDFSTLDTNPVDGNADISDVGFTLMLPADPSDIQNVTSMLSGRTWNLNSYDAAFLTGQGLGDGTKDAFLLTMNPGQTLITHLAFAQIDLVSFEVVNPPTSGDLYFLENTDPIAQGAGNVLDSFFNADIDGVGNGAGTSDYYGGNDPSMDSFSFGTLSVNEQLFNEITIYPNPVSETLRVVSSKNIEKIEIYNVQGKLELMAENRNEVEVNKLSTGMYLLKLYSGGKHVVKQIIIK